MLGEGIRVFTSLEAAEGFIAKQEIINLEQYSTRDTQKDFGLSCNGFSHIFQQGMLSKVCSMNNDFSRDIMS